MGWLVAARIVIHGAIEKTRRYIRGEVKYNIGDFEYQRWRRAFFWKYYRTMLNGLTKERIRQILQENNENIKKICNIYKIQNEEKKPYEQQLVDILMQHYFTLLIQEKGLNHALAWRCKEKYKCGKPLSFEQLEKLIEARRSGKGYYRCIKYAGITTEKEEAVRQKIPYVKYVLMRALHDIL